MEVEATDIADVLVLKPRYFHDVRGYLVETYSKREAQHMRLPTDFVQDNQSLSLKAGTVRALHFQVPPRSQAKLIRVLRGSIYDVAVDLRVDSPTYGRWVGKVLSAQTGEQMFVPRGFAHGYCTLEPNTEVAYKVDDYYAPECEQGLAWDDPIFAIDWPVAHADTILSDRDRKLGSAAAFVSPFRCRDV
jgi:dTDP-4-dehydrorhamnose 3,5-epimerase